MEGKRALKTFAPFDAEREAERGGREGGRGIHARVHAWRAAAAQDQDRPRTDPAGTRGLSVASPALGNTM